MFFNVAEPNVNGVYASLMQRFFHASDFNVHTKESRNGPMIELKGPTCLEYTRPYQCVLTDEVRDANPFFHLMEAMWMLAGERDVAFPAMFAKQIWEYSDDKETLHGAYGHRWRHYFGMDQLTYIIQLLRRDPNSQRAYLAMWSPQGDMPPWSKDHPCNVGAAFLKRGDNLTMTVYNRSNDAVWGATGANAVHFSFLLQYIAYRVGLGCGSYYHVANSMHIYPEVPAVKRILNNGVGFVEPYHTLSHCPLLSEGEDGAAFLRVLKRVVDGMRDGSFKAPSNTGYKFIDNVVAPMYNAHCFYKDGHYDLAIASCTNITATDWRFACLQWLARRKEQHAAKKDEPQTAG